MINTTLSDGVTELGGMNLLGSYGPYLIGILFWTALWGVSCMQT